MPVGPSDDILRREAFAGRGVYGEFSTLRRPESGMDEIVRLTDPSASVETIHWGRNYIFAAEYKTESGQVPVVVKQFSNQGPRKRLDRRWRGSKAERSWRVAGELVRQGLATPEPLLWMESEEPEGPSFFIAKRIENAYEVRNFFRRLNNDPGDDAFPDVDAKEFLENLGGLARRVNDAGILYRDLSMGNILAVENQRQIDLFLIDFNRARTGRRLGVYSRTRDICRLPILKREHQAAFLKGYWGYVPARWAFRRWFYDLSVRGYIFKHAFKKRIRGLRFQRKHAHGGSHHPHIPSAESGASARDKSVWDHLSDQPHQHATRSEKWAIRAADSPSHLRDAAIILSSLPAVRRRYVELRESRHAEPVAFTGVGLAVRPWTDDPAAGLVRHRRTRSQIGVVAAPPVGARSRAGRATCQGSGRRRPRRGIRDSAESRSGARPCPLASCGDRIGRDLHTFRTTIPGRTGNQPQQVGHLDATGVHRSLSRSIGNTAGLRGRRGHGAGGHRFRIPVPARSGQSECSGL